MTATDLVLRITELLRGENVVEKFVEFHGPGMKQLTLTDRATIANMSPEYGATMGFFPVDEKTIDYLKITNREDRADIVACYTRETGLFYDGTHDPDYSKTIAFDISEVEPSVAGPSRPQDRIVLTDLKEKFNQIVGPDDFGGSGIGMAKESRWPTTAARIAAKQAPPAVPRSCRVQRKVLPMTSVTAAW